MYRQISHEVKTSDNKIWSVNRICQEKYFSSKVMQKLKHGDYFQTSFFLEKGLGIVFSPHFVYDFSRKMFLMLNSINRTNFVV